MAVQPQTDFQVAIDATIAQPEFFVVAKLILKLISVFDHFNCNNRAARVASSKLTHSGIVIGNAKHGLISKIRRKKMEWPYRQIASLENMLYDAIRDFLKYTAMNSLQYVLIGDNLEHKLDRFDEELTDLITDLIKDYSLKREFFSFPPGIKYGLLISANIRKHVIEAATDASYLLQFADSNDLNVYVNADQNEHTVTNAASDTSSVNSSSELVYNHIVAEVISNSKQSAISKDGSNIKSKYTKDFIGFVSDLHNFAECLNQVMINAKFELKLSAHAVITQSAMRLFWANDIDKFEGVTVETLCDALSAALKRHSEDPATVDALVASFDAALTPPKGSLFQLIDADVDGASSGGMPSSSSTYSIDAVEIGKLVRGIDPNELDLEIVIGQLLSLSGSFYDHDTDDGMAIPHRLQNFPAVHMGKAASSSSSEYASRHADCALEPIQFVSASGPITSSGQIICTDSRNCSKLMENNVMIDEDMENSLMLLLFGKSTGMVEVFGRKGCGKSTLLLYVINKYWSQGGFISGKTVFWIDFCGVCTVQQAIARVVSQLGLRGVNMGDDMASFFALLSAYFKSRNSNSSGNHITGNNLIVFDNIDSGILQQQYAREVPSKSHPFILFLWSLYDMCKELEDQHRFLFVANTPISSCRLFKSKHAQKNSNKHTDIYASASSASTIDSLMNMRFNEQYAFPAMLSPSVLFDMATVLCPIDPCSLLIASMGVPGEMMTLASMCKLSTIRQVSEYIEGTIASTTATKVYNAHAHAPRASTSGTQSSDATTTATDKSSEHVGVRLDATSRSRILQALQSPDVGDTIVLAKYRDYIINAAVADIISNFSADELLLASCLSAQQNLFYSAHAVANSSTAISDSLSFSTFSPFDASMVWSVTRDEFGSNDLERWWLAWSGLISKGWVVCVSPQLGFMIRNPPFYLSRFGDVGVDANHASASAGNASLLLHYNWANEFASSHLHTLTLPCIERLWRNYLCHWCAFIATDIYETCLYGGPRVADHVNRHYVHVENAVRVFTLDYLSLFEEAASASGNGDDINVDALLTINTQDNAEEDSRLTSAQLLLLQLATQLAGKLHIVLDHCISRTLALEIAVFVFKLVRNNPTNAQAASTTSYKNVCLLTEVDVIRQYLRGDKEKIALAKDRLLHLLSSQKVDVNQYYSIPTTYSSVINFDVIDERLLNYLSEGNRQAVLHSKTIEPTTLSQMLSLLGKIELFEGQQTRASVLFAYAMLWWQLGMQTQTRNAATTNSFTAKPTSNGDSDSPGKNKRKRGERKSNVAVSFAERGAAQSNNEQAAAAGAATSLAVAEQQADSKQSQQQTPRSQSARKGSSKKAAASKENSDTSSGNKTNSKGNNKENAVVESDYFKSSQQRQNQQQNDEEKYATPSPQAAAAQEKSKQSSEKHTQANVGDTGTHAVVRADDDSTEVALFDEDGIPYNTQAGKSSSRRKAAGTGTEQVKAGCHCVIA
jgi:hypothetical protein